MRYVVNWQYFLDKLGEGVEDAAMGGQFSLLASSIHDAFELAAIEAYHQLDLVQAMVPPCAFVALTICQPEGMKVLGYGEVDILGEILKK